MPELRTMFATLNLSEDTNLTSTDTQIKIGIMSVLAAMITLGNIAVIMVISSSVSGWSRNSRYFLFSLTGADSAFGLIITPLNLCVSLAKDYSEGPDSLCHIVAFFNATIYSTCMYTLNTISLERYIAVFYPLKYSLMTRRRILLLIAFAWCFPPFLLVPIYFPNGTIEVHFSTASLVCNPSLTLTCLLFFPCSIIMTCANLRLWFAAMRLRVKMRSQHSQHLGRHNRPVASRVLVPVMTVYYTCWTPCIAVIIYNAISGNIVTEWIEFVVVWLPTANRFLNCIFYFWITHSFHRKFCLLFQWLCLCPDLAKALDTASSQTVVWDNNNTLQERCSSVLSTCTLASDTPF
ncbi:LOW QUALITY PROTEIN: histamine H2 receptor [Salvelinus alpinus]